MARRTSPKSKSPRRGFLQKQIQMLKACFAVLSLAETGKDEVKKKAARKLQDGLKKQIRQKEAALKELKKAA